MDIEKNTRQEPPAESGEGAQPVEAALVENGVPAVEGQERQNLPENAEPAVVAAEPANSLEHGEPDAEETEATVVLDNGVPATDVASLDTIEVSIEEPTTPDALETIEQPVGEAEATVSSLDTIEQSAGEATVSSLDTIEVGGEDAETVLLPANAALVAQVPDAPDVAQSGQNVPDVLASGIPTRRRRRYSPWLQIGVGVLLACLVGGIVLAVGLPHGANTPGTKVLVTPTPVPPLNVTKWCTAPSALVGAQAGAVSLNKVVALSTNDAWLLGGTSQGITFTGNTGRDFPLLEHWDGKNWSVVQTADTSALLNHLLNKVGGGKASESVSLHDIAVLSDQNIWAVGSISVTKTSKSPMPVSVPGLPVVASTILSVGQPLIEHWDGSTWQVVTSPTGNSQMAILPGSSNELTSISAVSSNDIWATGTQMDKSSSQPGDGMPNGFFFVNQRVPLVEHWDGTNWTERQLPDSLRKGAMFISSNIQAISNTDVWFFNASVNIGFVQTQPVATVPNGSTNKVIISSGYASSRGASTSNLFHWNGQAWQKMSLPGKLGKNASLKSVQVIADDNIWAVVSTISVGKKQNYETDTLYHWDGSAWSLASGSAGVDPKSSLDSFSVIAPDNIWLLGSTDKNQPLAQHWNGKTWSAVVLTFPTYGTVQSVAVAGQHAWAVVTKWYSTQNGSSAFVPIGGDGGLTGFEAVLEANC